MCSEENYFSLPTSDSASDQAPILHRNQDVIIVKLIGKRLYINGFVYIKNHTDAKNKVHWECRRYRKQKCHARAITSDPTLDENIVLFRGLEESPHDHKPSPQEVEEAEETAKSGNEWKRKSQLLDGTFSGSGSDSKTRMSIEVPQQETISNGIAKEIETDQSITKQSVQLTARKETSNLESNIDYIHNRMHVKLIGKRLCIDGYIYTKHSNGSEINWVCKRYRKTGCNARAFTSNPFQGDVFSINKVDKLSNHHHPPSVLEVEEAELIAKLECNRSKLECSQVDQCLEKSNGSEDRNQNQHSNHSSTSEKFTEASRVESHPQPSQSKTRKRSSVLPPTINKSTNSPRLIGARLCIDGYIYVKSSKRTDRVLWECKRYRKEGCPGRASTSGPSNGKLIVYRGPEISKHNHPPSPDEVEQAELLTKINPNSRKAKSKQTPRVLDKVKSKVLQTQLSYDNYSSNSAKIGKNLAMKEGPRIRSQYYRASKSLAPISGKNYEIRRNGLLKDDQVYRKFLVKFSKKPIFDRQSVIEALQIIYSSKQGCLMAYATVLENRDRIERDLEVLKNNPHAVITALNADRIATSKEDDSTEAIMDADRDGKIAETASFSGESPTAVESDDASETIGDEQAVVDIGTSEGNEGTGSSKPQVILPLRQEENAIIISTVSGATDTTHLSASRSISPNLSHDKPKIEREIVCIDLTDDSDETPKEKQIVGNDLRIPLHLNQAQSILYIPGNPITFLQNIEAGNACSMRDLYTNSMVDIGSIGLPCQNYLQNQNTSNPNVPSAHFSPSMYYPLNSHSPQNIRYSSSDVVNDMQIPLMINIPNMKSEMKNNATTNCEHLYAHLQVFQQPNKNNDH